MWPRTCSSITSAMSAFHGARAATICCRTSLQPRSVSKALSKALNLSADPAHPRQQLGLFTDRVSHFRCSLIPYPGMVPFCQDNSVLAE